MNDYIYYLYECINRAVPNSSNTDHVDVPWDRLPHEILTMIFSYLDISDKESVEQTCKSWQRCCMSPSLWREMSFQFRSIDSQIVATEAYRLIIKKGDHLRRLNIQIGTPTLAQVDKMAECIEGLLDIISLPPACNSIEHFSLGNLSISNEWRFFTTQKHTIYRALSQCFFRLNNLKSIDFTSCNLSAPDGIRLLRMLRRSPCRHNVYSLVLHNFFRKSYTAINGGRLPVVLYTSFLALRELSLDARLLNTKLLKMLTDASKCRQKLQHLKIFFEKDRHSCTAISKRSWLEVRESCPDLRVSVDMCDWNPVWDFKTLFPETMPLTDFAINLSIRRPARIINLLLSFVLHDLADRLPSMLENIKLITNVKSGPKLDTAIIYLISKCPNISNIDIGIDNVTKDTVDRIMDIVSRRQFKVKMCLGRRKRKNQTLVQNRR